MERLTVLSPWAEMDWSKACGLQPRLDTLNGKTIGMFSHFKGHSPLILKEVEREIEKEYPQARFSYWQYPKDTTEVENDDALRDEFHAWLSGVDGVIAAYGDAGSCAMYHALNTTYVERCGKPAVLLTKEDILMSAKCGASAGRLPHLRMVTCMLQDLSFEPVLDQALIERVIRPAVVPTVAGLIDGLLRPLTDEEAAPAPNTANAYADETFVGTAQEINDHFYRRGWTNGAPIVPPTREAVDEMLRGTDLPPEYVVAELPPMKGKATVGKIAINAVMAGCLPVHMPILIAAVEAMTDEKIHLVGWTCSVAGFAPLLIVNGPVRRQIGLNCDNNILSPYFRSNTVLAHAFSLIVMNLTGVRPTREDNSYTGHESRFGICFGENEEASPWKALPAEYGLEDGDNALTLCWLHHRTWLGGCKNAADALKKMCATDDPGAFDPGCSFIISPAWAKMLADAGMSRSDVATYISEYARKPFGNSPIRWMVDNHHMPELPIPMGDPAISCRKYWSTKHLQIIVAGSAGSPRCVAMTGGGDHGGPACVKLRLPKAWDELVQEYAERTKMPDYIAY